MKEEAYKYLTFVEDDCKDVRHFLDKGDLASAANAAQDVLCSAGDLSDVLEEA